MEYNILTSALCENNITEGNVVLPNTVMYYIADFNTTYITTLSGSDILVLDFDFGCRIHIDRFEYKFIDSSASQAETASGISFYFKDESFEDYYELTTQIGMDNIFYTTLSGSPTITGSNTFAPRYLKMKHSIGNTYGGPTLSGGFLYGLRAINDGDIVNFGESANKNTETIDIARGGTADVRALPIYNSGSTIADALVNLEPTYTDLDEAVYISISEDGPWIQVFDDDIVQINDDNFDYGTYSNVEYNDNQLRLEGYTLKNNNFCSNHSYGIYISPIIKQNDTSFNRTIIKKDSNYNGHIVVDEGDPGETIEIRYNNVKPKVYAVIRELYSYEDGNYYRLAYKDRWLESGTVKEESTWYFASCSTAYRSWTDYGVVYDQVTNRWAGWAHMDTTSTTSSELYFYNNDDINSTTNKLINHHSSSGSPINFIIKEFKLDSAGGIWVYFYSQGYSTSYFVDATGYYLVYFDSDFNTIVKLYTDEQTIGVLDVNYTTKEIWYTLPDSAVIQKLGIDGTIALSFDDSDYTDDLGGLAVLSDGNIVFGNGKDIHYLRYDGLYLSDYFIENAATDSVNYIAIDGTGYETIWILDGLTVGLLYVSGDRKGEYAFRVDNIGYPIRMTAVTGGVWVQCTDSEVTGTTIMRYISKENKRIDTEFSPENNSFPTVIYQDYTNINYVSKMPIAVDTIWPSLSWQKVATDGFLLPEDNYYQLRLTLRKQKLNERFPESNYVVSDDQEYPTGDYFDYSYAEPSDIFWGDWSDYPNLTKIYTISGSLNMISDGFENTYITTEGITAVGLSDSGYIEIIMGYKIGEGSSSGLYEHLYIKLENAVEGADDYIYVKIYITTSNYTYIQAGNSAGVYSSTILGTSLSFREGELRFYINLDSNMFRPDYRQSPSSSWVTGGIVSKSTFSVYNIKIESGANSSNMYINYIYINEGKIYPTADAPRIFSIYEQSMLELDDIYPNTYKNVYLKTFVSKDSSVSSNASMDVKARWRIASY